MARLDPAGGSAYEAHFERLWDYVKKYVIDARHGGWLPNGLDTNPEASKRPKASMWKDASHEVEALLECLPASTGTTTP
jgi:mannobiose 2-epimerase